MKIAIVVQRYGVEVCGGAELLARSLAGHLSKHFPVDVITTTALHYSSWAPHYPEQHQEQDGITIHRFHASHPRNRLRCGALLRFITRFPHPAYLEKLWIKENGPWSPPLLSFLNEKKDSFDFFFFVSYFFATTFFGLPPLRKKAILIPTAHDEPMVRLHCIRNLFKMPLSLVFLTPEEQDLIRRLSRIPDHRSEVIGTGVDLPQGTRTGTAGNKPGGREYIICIGRISKGKGAQLLLDYFCTFLKETARDLYLIMAGPSDLEHLPQHPHIEYTGFIPEEQKFSLIRGARVLVNPSFQESFSIVLIESWLSGVPVLVNEQCRVLNGQIERSGGGLGFGDYASFSRNLSFMLDNREVCQSMAGQGREYALSNYSWDVIEKKYVALLERLASGKQGQEDGGLSESSVQRLKIQDVNRLRQVDAGETGKIEGN